MGWTWYANVWTKTDGDWLWHLKEKLVTGGWSVASSGDGASTYNASGDVHTSYTTLDTSTAWMRLRANASMSPQRELLIQNITGNGVYRCWYSSDGTGFTGGSPAAGTRPTASDEQGVVNFPTGTTRILPNENGIYSEFLIGDSSEQWSFLAGAREYGNEYYASMLYLDVLSEANASDADPAVIGIELKANAKAALDETNSNIVSTKSNPASGTGGTRGWYKKGLSGAAWVAFPPCLWGHNDGTVSALVSMGGATRRWNLNENERWPELICHYMRGGGFATEKGYKGVSRLFKVIPVGIGGIKRNHDGSRLGIGSFSIPWNDTRVEL